MQGSEADVSGAVRNWQLNRRPDVTEEDGSASTGNDGSGSRETEGGCDELLESIWCQTEKKKHSELRNGVSSFFILADRRVQTWSLAEMQNHGGGGKRRRKKE